jgi:Mce-associated membrane protein
MRLDTSPTLYDVLGVAPDASAGEIKTAWRDAAERFEPGEGGSARQFRLFNDAAEVLLDPARRQAYDEQLATREPSTTPGGSADEATPAAAVPTAPVPGASRATASAVAPVVSRWAARRRRRAQKETARPRPEPTEPTEPTERRRPRPLAAVLGVLGVPATVVVALVVAAAVGLAAYFVVEAEQAEAYQEALDRAPAAAENAALAVLSYDHETLEADRDAAAKFLSPGYRPDYVETFDKLVSDSATETKATVEAEVLASSAMNTGSEDDPDRVPVLLFVNQTTTSAATSADQPSVALNRVRFDMVRRDGTWLVDGITSY